MITTSGEIFQIKLATDFGERAVIDPTPLAKAPFIANKAAPGYFSLPIINNVLPLEYLSELEGGR